MTSSQLTIDMLVLDAIQDDVEQIPSIMRMLAEWRQRIEDEHTSDDVVEALARLVQAGLVAVLEESFEKPELVPVGAPEFSDAALHRYWYEPTPRGRAVWSAWDKDVESE